MEKTQSKNITHLMTMFLIITIAGSSIFATASAHNPPMNIKTYAFLAVAPNPIGVGQTATITFWLSMLPPTANGQYGDKWTFNVNVTKPDGTSQMIVSNQQSDPVGSGYATFTPDQTGNYTFQMSFPGTVIKNANPNPVTVSYSNSAYINDTFLPSTSPKITVTVQADPIPGYPSVPLPTDYWARPINGQNREWYSISGNWLRSGHDPGNSYAPYTTAPKSAHILWSKPLALGGLIGGEFGSSGTSEYYAGLSYETKFVAPVIIQGRLYYNEYPSVRYAETDHYPPGFDCVDLRTGQTLWTANTTVTFGQVLDFVTPDQYGGTAYLWGPGPNNTASATTTWYMMDAFNGNTLCKFINVPSLSTSAPGANMAYGTDGSILVYVIGNGWLACWNSTLALLNYDAAIPNIDVNRVNWYYNWRPPYGATIDGNKGYQWNVTIPKLSVSQSISKISSDYSVILATAKPTLDTETDVAYNANTGALLWTQNRTIVPASTAFSPFGPMAEGVYSFYDQDNMQWTLYNYNSTGSKVWGPTTPYNDAWGMYSAGSAIAYGNLYASAWDGQIHAYNLATGANTWNYNTGSSGFETAYGTWPLPMGFLVADGEIFACAGHTHLQPMFRGAKMYCINATTGQPLWNISGWLQTPSIADGYLVAHNIYDNQIYCFGKGQTATTVEAPMTAVTKGTGLVIRGTVTDQSPGALGTPAISDNCMSEYMAYLYMQQQKPSDITGVRVSIDAIDPNGNLIHIGDTTSDASGLYSVQVDPSSLTSGLGKYTVIANFEGSNSYFPSSAETALVVGSPTETASPAPVTTSESTGMYFVYSTIAIIVAIVIVAVALVLVLKKRP
jgi:outer membrane protein assembly factor BamB